MGWSSGTERMKALIRSLKKHVHYASVREAVYLDMIRDFQNEGDWDTANECAGLDPAFDLALVVENGCVRGESV